MGRRPQAGRDLKIIQGHRRDEFFRKMRRRGGTPRMPTQGMTTTVDETLEPVAEDEATAEATPAVSEDGAEAAVSEDGAEAAESETAAEAAESDASEDAPQEIPGASSPRA